MQAMRVFQGLVVASLGVVAFLTAVGILVGQTTLPNRIPQAAPYNTQETQFYPHPFEADWEGVNNPGTCSNCHSRIFDEWNGSMMSNSWRDPGWRGAFLLIARLTATDGNCDIPNPPDATARSEINPFADGLSVRQRLENGDIPSRRPSGPLGIAGSQLGARRRPDSIQLPPNLLAACGASGGIHPGP